MAFRLCRMLNRENKVYRYFGLTNPCCLVWLLYITALRILILLLLLILLISLHLHILFFFIYFLLFSFLFFLVILVIVTHPHSRSHYRKWANDTYSASNYALIGLLLGCLTEYEVLLLHRGP